MVMNSKIIILLISMLLTLSKNTDAVLNGKQADLGEFPFVASLWHVQIRHVCTAAIISESYLLTAAHCVVGNSEGDYGIIYGVTEFSRMANIALIKKFYPHEHYKPATFIDIQVDRAGQGNGSVCPLMIADQLPKNDIAIIETFSPMDTNLPTFSPLTSETDDDDDDEGPSAKRRRKSTVAKIDVTKSFPGHCATCVFAGWGLTAIQKNSQHSNVLLYLSMTIHDATDCLLEWCETNSDTFCAQHESRNSSPAEGDSGGPLVCNGVLVGVLSTTGYNQHLPSKFVDVSQYYESFIKPFLEKKPDSTKTEL